MELRLSKERRALFLEAKGLFEVPSWSRFCKTEKCAVTTWVI